MPKYQASIPSLKLTWPLAPNGKNPPHFPRDFGVPDFPIGISAQILALQIGKIAVLPLAGIKIFSPPKDAELE